MKRNFSESIIMIVSVCAFLSFCLILPNNYPDYFKRLATETKITIEQGMSAKDAAAAIGSAGLVRSEKLLIKAMVELGIDRTLKPGTYTLTPGPEMNVARQLLKAKPEYEVVTIVPGTRYSALSARFMYESEDVFGKELSDKENFPKKLHDLLPENNRDRIAFLLPETYNLAPGSNIAKELIKSASNHWMLKLSDKLPPNVTAQKLANTATLASLIEGEAKVAEERPILAGIFLKRIEKNMRLQSCATVVYCWEERGVKKQSLTYNDLKVESPYNTYLNGGLPPGPISVPSISSWESALKPQYTDYLFFFASEDGHHQFSKTYEEHVRKQKKP